MVIEVRAQTLRRVVCENTMIDMNGLIQRETKTRRQKERNTEREREVVAQTERVQIVCLRITECLPLYPEIERDYVCFQRGF